MLLNLVLNSVHTDLLELGTGATTHLAHIERTASRKLRIERVSGGHIWWVAPTHSEISRVMWEWVGWNHLTISEGRMVNLMASGILFGIWRRFSVLASWNTHLVNNINKLISLHFIIDHISLFKRLQNEKRNSVHLYFLSLARKIEVFAIRYLSSLSPQHVSKGILQYLEEINFFVFVDSFFIRVQTTFFFSTDTLVFKLW